MNTQTSNAASLFLCNMEMDQILSSEALTARRAAIRPMRHERSMGWLYRRPVS
jgi:hypothetical protein